jgi:hypothetical protein
MSNSELSQLETALVGGTPFPFVSWRRVSSIKGRRACSTFVALILWLYPAPTSQSARASPGMYSMELNASAPESQVLELPLQMEGAL